MPSTHYGGVPRPVALRLNTPVNSLIAPPQRRPGLTSQAGRQPNLGPEIGEDWTLGADSRAGQSREKVSLDGLQDDLRNEIAAPISGGADGDLTDHTLGPSLQRSVPTTNVRIWRW